MQRTRFKNLVLLLCLAVLSSVAYAEKGDNTATPSAEEKPAVLKTTSYFQGTWIGTWKIEGRTGRDITITVGPKNPDGTFDIEYSWGSGKDIRGGSILPGTVKAKGREDGEKMVLDYYDTVYFKTFSIILTKHEDVRVKAVHEGGILKPVAYLSRQ